MKIFHLWKRKPLRQYGFDPAQCCMLRVARRNSGRYGERWAGCIITIIFGIYLSVADVPALRPVTNKGGAVAFVA